MCFIVGAFLISDKQQVEEITDGKDASADHSDEHSDEPEAQHFSQNDYLGE
jgi:hypothetical protein